MAAEIATCFLTMASNPVPHNLPTQMAQAKAAANLSRMVAIPRQYGMTTIFYFSKPMDLSVAEQARCLMRRGDIERASNLVEEEIRRIGEGVNTGVSTGVNNNEVWCLRFLRAQVLNVRGQVEEAFSYLESFRPPDAADIESIARPQDATCLVFWFSGPVRNLASIIQRG
jgi:hypothetical protein